MGRHIPVRIVHERFSLHRNAAFGACFALGFLRFAALLRFEPILRLFVVVS